MIWFLATLAFGSPVADTAAAAPAETGDTGEPVIVDPNGDLDLDGDQWTPNQGDCDDNEPKASPGIAEETCEDRIDNNCNGLYDEGCDSRVRQATIRGGGGCTGGAGVGGTALLLLWLPRVRRRR